MATQIYERLSTVYDLDWGKWSRQYVPLIQEMLAETGISKAKVLDLACGTGGLAVDIANIGHSVLGVDISHEMIAVAKSKARNLANASFQVQDMVHFGTDDKFNCAICTFDSLNYLLDINDLKAVINNVAVTLHPEGLFIFDCNTDHLYETLQKGTHQRELGGESFLQKLHYDRENRIATTIFEFSDGTIEVHMQRPYTPDEIGPILANVGLGVLHTFCDFHRKLYTGESERFICIAKKQK